MIKSLLILCFFLLSLFTTGQELKIKNRDPDALTGSVFAVTIADNSLSFQEREKKIWKEIRSGNIPGFYRKLIQIKDTVNLGNKVYDVSYYVLPDYLAVGSDSDYFYCPMSPVLAQHVARFFKCALPTRKMVDQIYQAALVKMTPEPVPPSNEMNTVPVFIRHNDLVHAQRKKTKDRFPLGSLVAGNKKDVVISNKIYPDNNHLKVVIYGWHKPDGKPIQPLYGGHTADWVDYSHGIRLVQRKINVNGRGMKIRRVLKSRELHLLLSDEGIISKPSYPRKYPEAP